MKNISTLNKEEKLKEIILHINSLFNQRWRIWKRLRISPEILIPEKIDLDKLSEYLMNSVFLDNVYFIIDSPKFETKNEKGQNMVTETYQFDKIEDIENIVISNPKKYIMLYNISLSMGKFQVRCVLFDDKLKIRSEKIDKILND